MTEQNWAILKTGEQKKSTNNGKFLSSVNFSLARYVFITGQQSLCETRIIPLFMVNHNMQYSDTVTQGTTEVAKEEQYNWIISYRQSASFLRNQYSDLNSHL